MAIRTVKQGWTYHTQTKGPASNPSGRTKFQWTVISLAYPLLRAIINLFTWMKNQNVTLRIYKIEISITGTDPLGRLALHHKKNSLPHQ
jgi:hypothetical protein